MELASVTAWLLAAATAANILTTLYTIIKSRSDKRKVDAETTVSIPVDAANETTAASLALCKDLREEINRIKEDHARQIKLLQEEITRLNGRIKELEDAK